MYVHESIRLLVPLLPRTFCRLTDGIEDGVQILINLPTIGQLDAVTSDATNGYQWWMGSPKMNPTPGDPKMIRSNTKQTRGFKKHQDISGLLWEHPSFADDVLGTQVPIS